MRLSIQKQRYLEMSEQCLIEWVMTVAQQRAQDQDYTVHGLESKTVMPARWNPLIHDYEACAEEEATAILVEARFDVTHANGHRLVERIDTGRYL